MWSRAHSPIPLVDPKKLRFCIDNQLNVLLEGRHGVGKTSVVLQAFREAGLNLLVFSGSTMDPWVDFVGVPRPVARPDGSTVLELIRRPEFADDQIDAIFIDEYNRAPAKVRNAAMEILQFKSVNGVRSNRLKCVWAAINPSDSHEYDAERLDSAQLDRFHIHLKIPFRPCPKYFVNCHGSRGRAAMEWWDGLGPDAQAKVSPRRLDYALTIEAAGGSLKDVLPDGSNPASLAKLLREGPIFDRLKKLLDEGDKEGARQVLNDPATGSQALEHVVTSKAATVFFLPLLEKEKLQSLLYNPTVLEQIIRFSANVEEFSDVLETQRITGGDAVLTRKIEGIAKKLGVRLTQSGQPTLVSHVLPIDDKSLKGLDPHGRFCV